MEESSEDESLMLARGSDLLLLSLYGEVRICQGAFGLRLRERCRVVVLTHSLLEIS